MKNKVLKSVLPVLCVAFTVAGAASCKGKTEHVHTYSSEWSKDATGHWYDMTCDCEDVPVKAGHVDKNNDKACDICEYTDHTHTYQVDDDWTVDCENHWRAPTCGCIVAGTDKAAHVDENEDGKCDTCSYVIKDIHVHVFDDEWTSDETDHWHAALCEHKDEVDGKEAHVLNAAGDCTVCGAHVQDVDVADIGEVLAAAQANNDKVTYGDVIATEAVYGGVGAETLESAKTEKVHFALGNGQSYIQWVSFDKDMNYLGVEEQWFERLNEEDVFGVAKLNGEYELSRIAGDAQFLNGYNYIPGSVIPSAADDTSTLANMLVALHNQMKAGVRVSNAKESLKDGVYAFSYEYYSENIVKSSQGSDNAGEWLIELEYYKVKVEFTVNEDMVINSADFQVEVYRDFEADKDIDYTVTNNEDGTVTISDVKLKETANPSFYIYNVSQMSGERTFTTPYPRQSLLPTSFEFLYVLETYQDPDTLSDLYATKTEAIGETLEILKGEYAKFALGDILPKTASTKFLTSDDFTFTFVNNDPDSEARAWDPNNTFLNKYNSMNGLLKLKILDLGEYTVTIGFAGLEKTFILKVVNEKTVVLPEDDENTVNVATTDTYNWEKDLYSYTAKEEGKYTFTLPAGLGIQKKGENAPLVDFYNNESGTTVDVALKANETFEFYVASTEKKTWVINVSFVAGTVGGDDEGGDTEVTETALIIGNTPINAENVTFAYTATEAGTLNLAAGAAIMGMVEMSYTVNGGDSTVLELNSNVDLVLAEGDKVVITVVAEGYSSITASWTAEAGEEVSETALKIGNTQINAENVTFAYTATEAGTLNLAAGAAIMGMVEMSYTVNGGESTVLELSTNVNLELAEGDKVVITVVAEGYSSITASWTAGGSGGEQPSEPDGTEENPYVITGETTIMISATTYSAIFVKVSAGVTVSLNCAAKFYTDPTDMSTSVGTTVTPDVDTLYYVYADTMAGAMGQLVATVGGSEGGDTEVTETALEIGSTQINAENVTFAYTATEAGTLNLAAGAAIMGMVEMSYTVNGGDSTVLALSSNVDLVLAEGDKVVITVVAEGYSSITASWTADGSSDEVVKGSQDNPYVLKLNEETTIEVTADYTADNYYVYAQITVPETGWYQFGSGWSYGGDNAMMQANDGTLLVYAEKDSALVVYYYVESATTIVVEVVEGEVMAASAGYGDSAENAISITNVGSYAMIVDYAVSADGLYVNFTAPATGYYTFSFSNFDNVLTYNGATYCSNENGDLTLYAQANSTYSFLLDNIDFDDNWQAIKANGSFFFSVVKLTVLTVGENTVVGEGEASETVVITVETTGIYTVSIEDLGEESINLYGDVSVDGYNPWGGSAYSVTVELTAGEVYLASVNFPSDQTTWKPMSGSWKITIAEADEVEVSETALIIGNTQINAENVTFAYTATEAGTLNLAAGAAIMGMVEMSYTVNGGDSTVLELSSNVDLVLAEGDKVVITVVAEGYSSITASWTAEAGEEVSETALEIGSTQINAENVTFAYTATEAGTLNLAAGAAIMGMVEMSYTVNGGESTVLELSTNVNLELAEGDKVVIMVVAEGYSSITATWKVAGAEPDGSAENPFVIESLPYTITQQGKHDVNYTYTATEACTIQITCPTGCYVTNNANVTAANGVYTFTLVAGQVVSLNTWTLSSTDVEYNYVISVVVETPDEGGEDSGEQGSVVTYMSEKHASGRYLKVEIDSANGTMTLTRSNMSGGWDAQTATAEYTYAFDGTTVTATNVSGQSCTFTWNADGTPASITWGTAVFVNFAVQA